MNSGYVLLFSKTWVKLEGFINCLLKLRLCEFIFKKSSEIENWKIPSEITLPLKEFFYEKKNWNQVLKLARQCCDCPLHMLINAMVLCFHVGFRNIPGCRTYRKRFPKNRATVLKKKKDDNETRIRNIFRKLGFPIFDVRKGGRGNANDGEYIFKFGFLIWNFL